MANAPEPPITRDDIDHARRMNSSLLKLGAWCKVHKRSYAANHMVNGRVEGQGCPRCKTEREWVTKAWAQMKAESMEITGPTLLERAEQLAGHRLHRYKRYD